MADQEGRRETIQESPIIKAQTIFPTQDGELHLKRKAPPPIGGIAADANANTATKAEAKAK